MAGVRTRCYIHTPTPPFSRIAGPIYVSSAPRSWGLSEESDARVAVAAADIQEEWIRPGMCWIVDDSDLGEPIWAGFVEEQDIPLAADELVVELIGPKKALLSVEFAVRLPVNVTRAYAIRQAIEAAQTRHGGIEPGDIDPTEGVASPIDVRGETVSDFIDTMHDETGLAEWRERVELRNGGKELVFYLDFGKLQRETNIVLGTKDLVDGLYTRGRVPSSLTLLGSASGFEERAVSTVAVESATTASEPPAEVLSELDAPSRDKITERDIGPGAAFHVTQISERISGDIAEFSRQRHVEILNKMDEMMLTVDMSRATTQAVRLGDVFYLDVRDWGSPALNLIINLKLHVFNTEIDTGTGERILECRVMD